MNPLSTSKYLKTHKKKVITSSLIIGLSIFLILFMQVEIRGLSDGSYLSTERLKFFSEGLAKTELVNGNINNQLMDDGVLEKIVPSIRYRSSMKSSIGVDTELIIYCMESGDIEFMLSKLGLKIKEGGIGSNDGKSIILSEMIANNKGVKVGDTLSKNNDNYLYIDGEYTVAGILEGKVNVAFIPTSEVKISSTDTRNYLYFWNEGYENKVNSVLLDNKSSDFQVNTYEKDKESIEDFSESFTLISNIIIVLMIIIQGVILAFTNYSEYYQRREEFGVEKALGFKEKSILIRIFKEIFILSVIGFLLGIILIYTYLFIINSFAFTRGVPLYRIIVDDIFKVIVIPIVITLSSVLPIAKLIRNTDTLKIIDGGI